MAKLLVIEGRRDIQTLLRRRFSSRAVSVEAVRSSDVALDRLRKNAIDVLICGAACDSDRSKGLEWIKALSRDFPRTQIVVVTDHDEAQQFSSNGIKTVSLPSIKQPGEIESFCALIRAALQKQPESGRENFAPGAYGPIEFEGMLGISLPMLQIFQRIIEAASTDISVFITGETGTGKDLVASAIHKRSKRRDKPYIAVNTGARNPDLIASELFGHEKGAYTGAFEKRQGRFEQANGGTIFLDEITTMDEKAQVSLLRVLEEKTFRRVGGEKDVHVDVRVIAATNENLEQAINQRSFREDLYYRLDVFRIHLPPLRERPSAAITLLADKFVSLFNTIYGKQVRKVSPETLRCLRRYSWPGNVRELKNVIQRAVLMAKGQELTPDLIPARIREAAGSSVRDSQMFPIHVGMTLDAVEREMIQMTLAASGGNKKKAAAILGISRRALYNKLKKYGVL